MVSLNYSEMAITHTNTLTNQYRSLLRLPLTNVLTLHISTE